MSILRLFLLPFILLAWVSTAAPPEYVIRNRMEILKPVALDAMQNEAQTTTLVEDRGQSVIVDITYRPFIVPHRVEANENWRIDNALMVDHLKPGATTNWDEAMREDLFSRLLSSGIDVSKLNDKQLVKQVTRWLVTHLDNRAPFAPFFVDFADGKISIPESVRSRVEKEKAAFKIETDDLFLNRGLFGKSMFYSNTRGSCTQTAIVWTTVFRALGIPTRMLVTIPAVDSNDPKQLGWLKTRIRNESVRAALVSETDASTRKWTNHSMVEVFVGKEWVRLDTKRLGQPIFRSRGAPYFFKLMTVVNRFNDLSEAGLHAWGVNAIRTWEGDPPSLSSANPYRSLGISDNWDEFRASSSANGFCPNGMREGLDAEEFDSLEVEENRP